MTDDLKIKENLNSLSGITFAVTVYGATMNSIFSTALLAIDRYIAVKYTLKYQTILTEKKILLLVLLWVISLLIPGITFILLSSHDEYQHICDIIFINFCLVVSVLRLSLSQYIHLVRKLRMKNIRKRIIYFGVKRKQFDRLKNIKNSLKGAFRFYIGTV